MPPGRERIRPRRWARALVVAAAVLAAGALEAASRPAVRSPAGMAVTPEPHATGVAVEVLRGGGNAVDAAIAAAMALAVSYPRAGNLGGGGFLLVRLPDGSFHALDHRETAPSALRPDSFRSLDGTVDAGRFLRHGLAVGVPGTVAGLWEAHRRWGSRPWAELLTPAIRLAAEGVPISPQIAESLVEESAHLARDPRARAVFFRDGEPLREGQRLVQSDLAATLRRIASEGPDGFYRGPVAEAIVETVRGAGGVMTAADLADYVPVVREPLVGSYRGHRVVTFPPPSSGGLLVLQILGMLADRGFPGDGFGSSRDTHLVVEAERRAFADRARWMGDPEYFEVPAQGLIDPAYLAERSAGIRERRATPSRKVAAGHPPGAESPETLHLTVADARGGVAALTTTLNSWYGVCRIAGPTGVLLNNEMDDFALAPGVPNQFGVTGGEANAVEGGKRPLSSMAPTIVETVEGGLLALGSPGGSTIPTTVVQVLIHLLDYGLELQEAVDAPRFHHQWLPDVVEYEAHAFPRDVRAALQRRGHVLKLRDDPLGNVAAIQIARDGMLYGAADPRGDGVAAGP